VALSTPFAPGTGDDLSITDTLGGISVGALDPVPGTLTVTAQNGGTLSVTGALSSVNEDIVLATVGGGNIDLGANVSTDTAGRSVTLTSSGAISQSDTVGISTGTLTGSATGAAILDGTNQIDNLGTFSANNLVLIDAGGLTVTGNVNGGATGVALITSGDLDVNSSISSAGGSIVLTALAADADVSLAAAVNAAPPAASICRRTPRTEPSTRPPPA
jgi:hypothetical protein